MFVLISTYACITLLDISTSLSLYNIYIYVYNNNNNYYYYYLLEEQFILSILHCSSYYIYFDFSQRASTNLIFFYY